MDGLEQDRELLRQLCEFAGLTATGLAKETGLSPSTIHRPYTGKALSRLSQPTVQKLRARFPDYGGWDAYLRGDPNFSLLPLDSGRLRPTDDSLAIPMLELGYGMGGTFLDGIDPGEVIEHFPRSFVRMFTKAPEQLLCFSHGIGDSMYPTIGDRDVLLIDRSRDTISVNDQIWVLSVGGIGMVKRVRMGGGKITLLSDNENVPDYDPGDDELQVIGRVIAVVRRI